MWNRKQAERGGSIIVLTLLCLVILLFFAALVVDVGIMKVVETELHSAADAAALASVNELGDNQKILDTAKDCLLYTSPSPRD